MASCEYKLPKIEYNWLEKTEEEARNKIWIAQRNYKIREWLKLKPIKFYVIVPLKIRKLKMGILVFRDLQKVIEQYQKLEEPELYKIVFVEYNLYDKSSFDELKLTEDMKCQTLKEW